MENTIISSRGFTIGNYYFEAFDLLKGKYVSLDFYNGQDLKIENVLYEILSGSRKIDGVLVKEEIIPIIPLVMKSSPLFFSKKTPLKYLEDNSPLPREKIISLLDEIGIDPKINIDHLGANERKMLSLEAAYSKSKNIIICTSGLDYNGLERIRNRVQQELSKGSVIEINYATSRGRDYLIDESQSSHKDVKDLSVR